MSTYLNWVIEHTPTVWWHDSADPTELAVGLSHGAVGVTTNPVLIAAAMKNRPAAWAPAIDGAIAQRLPDEQKAIALMRIAVSAAAEKLLPIFETSGGRHGHVCAQVNPLRHGDRESMMKMARRLHDWAPNIAVKLPATAAGLDVLEDCIARGITVTATVSFTVPQVIAIAERHRAGIARARAQGIEPGRCFAVLMIGRLDDYLRDIARDDGTVRIGEGDVCQAGLAVAKRAYSIYQERGYEAVLLIAALRGPYHLTELAGAAVVMSIHPLYQAAFRTEHFPREPFIDRPIAREVLDVLLQIPDFVRAYEPDGMTPREFLGYGATQRTLSQFCEVGWKPLETFHPEAPTASGVRGGAG